ncbi:capsular biosynthesis protein [Ciceribacter sp. L1K22]|nr:capsular biosynthesis protein [Ciceribacter sp. L1K22]
MSVVKQPRETKPVILFLQGPPSVFWRELSDAFELAGVKTLRVNFSLGDQLFWRKRGAINFRKPLKHWRGFVEALIKKEGVTDILYYADQLPYHRTAWEVAETLGVRCHAVEHGYLRPDWLTLERGGMGRFSHFPVDPAQISAIARSVAAPDLTVRYPHTFGQEAFNEVLYNLVAYFGRPFFPFFSDDKYYSALKDYLPWVVRAFFPTRHLASEELQNGLTPYFLVALQLQSDYQIRANSRFVHLADMLDEVIGSFARYADRNASLLIKQHPLDNGIERWGSRVTSISRRYGVEERVRFFEQGNLNAILKSATGVVVVNSTVGIHSIRTLKPTIALGCAVYDVEGLTHQDGIDSFWRNPSPVDPALVDDLVQALAATIQVKGNFYHREGKVVAIAEMVRRIVAREVNLPGGFLDTPPRLTWQKGIQARPEAMQ